jgi:hypothetical protein
MPSPVMLPAATIQDDFTTIFSEVHAGIIPSENIWLSCYKDGEPSIHGKISVSLHEQDRDRVELVGRGGVELTRKSQVSFFFLFLEWKDFNFIRFVSVGGWIRRRGGVGPSVRPLISCPGAAGAPLSVQVHRPLFSTRDQFCGFHFSERGLCGSFTFGRETCEYGC